MKPSDLVFVQESHGIFYGVITEINTYSDHLTQERKEVSVAMYDPFVSGNYATWYGGAEAVWTHGKHDYCGIQLTEWLAGIGAPSLRFALDLQAKMLKEAAEAKAAAENAAKAKETALAGNVEVSP